MLENYILRSNGTHKILQKYKHKKRIKQERHRLRGSPSLGYVHGETTSPSFYIMQQTDEIQPTANPL